MDEDKTQLPSNARKQKLQGLELPSNSDTKKRELLVAERKISAKKKVSGRIVTRKQSLGTRFAENFLGGDANSVGEYIFQDVLIPALKSMVSDMVTGGIEMFLFGDRQSSSRGSSSRKKPSMISYSNYFQDMARKPADSRASRSPRRGKLDNLYVNNRRDADVVLEMLDNIMEEFNVVTVADLLTTMDLESDYTDNKYGWTNLAKANVQRTPDGYKINVPRPESLD